MNTNELPPNTATQEEATALLREYGAELAVFNQKLLALTLKELRYAQVESLQALYQFWKVRAEKAEHHLSGLLAVIHRDGGHYEHAHGTDAAVAKAILVSIRLIDREEDSL